MKVQYCSDLHMEFHENMRFMKSLPLDPIGDVLDLHGEYTERPLALGTLGENSENWKAKYAFVLDNHSITPEMRNR